MQTFEEMLTEWQDISAQAKRLAAKERLLRDALVAAAFPTPTVGVNKRELADGRLVKATIKINVTIDQELAEQADAELTRRNFPGVFSIKRDLKKTAYDALTSDELKTIADSCVIRKPGAPTLEVV